MLCVLIFYISGGTYSLKFTLIYRFFKNFSWQFDFTPRVFARKRLRGNRQRNIFSYFFLVGCVLPGAWIEAAYLISQYNVIAHDRKMKLRIFTKKQFCRTKLKYISYIPASCYTRCFSPCFWRSHYQPQSWCCLYTSQMRFDTVGLLFVGCHQR